MQNHPRVPNAFAHPFASVASAMHSVSLGDRNGYKPLPYSQNNKKRRKDIDSAVILCYYSCNNNLLIL